MNVLSIENLSKHFGKLKAVDKLNLEVPPGTVFGLLGPNGSGKSTTLGMVLGTISPASGSYSWFGSGSDPKNRRRIGALLEKPNFYPYLTAGQNLKVSCDIKEVPNSRIDEVLDFVDLLPRKKSKFSTFSTGMKQRLSIAAALLSNPEVLILDEPTNGLDPQGIAEVRRLVTEIAGQGKTIILASHLLDEVEKVCTHVAVLKNGKLIVQGSVGEIVGDKFFVEVAAADLVSLKSALKEIPFVVGVQEEPGKLLVGLTGESDAADLNKILHGKNISVNHLAIRKNNLEKQFLDLVK